MVEAAESDMSLEFVVPREQPSTHDGSIGVRWSVLARPVGKASKANDLAVTVEE